MILEFFKTYGAAVFALTGVLVGHVVTVLLPFINKRREKIEAANRLSYWLLELWWIHDKTSQNQYAKQVQKGLEKFGVNVSSKEFDISMGNASKQILDGIDIVGSRNNSVALEKIQENLPSLMIHDPLLAFRLTGLDSAEDVNVKQFRENIVDEFQKIIPENVAFTPEPLINALNEVIAQEDDLSKYIEKRILSLSLIDGPMSWLRMKRYFHKMHTLAAKQGDKVASTILETISNAIIATKAKSPSNQG